MRVLLALILALMACTAQAQPQGVPDEPIVPDEPVVEALAPPREDNRGTWTFVWENDKFAGTDQNYTNGVHLAYLSGTRRPDRLARLALNMFVEDTSDIRVRRGYALGHSIFTPADTQAREPLPDQHPYAGWLYGEYSALVQTRDSVHRLSVQAGIVGPAALGEQIQNGFHDLINTDPVNGWDNQIGNEPGLVIGYDRMLRLGRLLDFGDLAVDVTPNFGFAVGNISTYARVGAMARIGEDLASDFGPPRVRPSLAGAGFFTPDGKFSWYLFGGVEARAVAHNIVLDGSLFRRGDPSVASKAFVGDAQVGLVVQIIGLQLGYTVVLRTREFDGQDKPQIFGAGSLSAKF